EEMDRRARAMRKRVENAQAKRVDQIVLVDKAASLLYDPLLQLDGIMIRDGWKTDTYNVRREDACCIEVRARDRTLQGRDPIVLLTFVVRYNDGRVYYEHDDTEITLDAALDFAATYIEGRLDE